MSYPQLGVQRTNTLKIGPGVGCRELPEVEDNAVCLSVHSHTHGHYSGEKLHHFRSILNEISDLTG